MAGTLLTSDLSAQLVDPSAALEVNSTSKGFLPPRMTTLQRDAISSIATTGLLIYNTTTDQLNTYNGSSWEAIRSGGSSSIADTDGDTQVQAEETTNENVLRFDTAGVERLQINSSGQVGMGTTTAVASSALLEMRSTTQGFLPPRMTTAQRDAISNPVAGVLIYNSTTDKMNYYANGEWRDAAFSYETATVIIHHGFEYGIVKSSTGHYWLDRNLGASRVAQSLTDTQAYGDLYQWGRTTDGHQSRTSTPVDGPVTAGNEQNNFIKSNISPYDWLSTPDDTRWNGGTKGAHDPCPEGFRVPTESELEAERALFSPNNSAGAFASVLKLSHGGHRNLNTAALAYPGSYGYYWSSNVGGISARRLRLNNSSTDWVSTYRSYAFSVRCIKE